MWEKRREKEKGGQTSKLPLSTPNPLQNPLRNPEWERRMNKKNKEDRRGDKKGRTEGRRGTYFSSLPKEGREGESIALLCCMIGEGKADTLLRDFSREGSEKKYFV
jgi:hypothetical protein